MRELLIFMEKGTLLPIIYGDLSHAQLKEALMNCTPNDRDATAWEGFVTGVMRITTYVNGVGQDDPGNGGSSGLWLICSNYIHVNDMRQYLHVKYVVRCARCYVVDTCVIAQEGIKAFILEDRNTQTLAITTKTADSLDLKNLVS